MRPKRRSLSLEQKVFIVRTFYETKDPKSVREAFNQQFGIDLSESSADILIPKIVTTFENSGSVTQNYPYEEESNSERVIFKDSNGTEIVYNVVFEDSHHVIQTEVEDESLTVFEEDANTDDKIEILVESPLQDQSLNSVTESPPSRNKKVALTPKERYAQRNQKHTCQFCSKVFSGRYLWAHYKKSHPKEKIYKCRTCDQLLQKWDEYKAHISSHEKADYPCSECGKNFQNTSAYNRHMKSHRGQKDHVCTYCAKGFQEATTLTLHLRSHTGEKPYKCGSCSKAFATKSSLVVHQRTHTGERPYKCNFCDKAFADTSTRNVRD